MSELEDRINSVLGDPAQMEKITNLAKSFMAGSSGQSDSLSSLLGSLGGEDMPELDPKLIGRISGALRSSEANRKRERTLLEAMMPYLSEKRRSKMNMAMRIARIAGIAKAAMGEMEDESDDKSL